MIEEGLESRWHQQIWDHPRGMFEMIQSGDLAVEIAGEAVRQASMEVDEKVARQAVSHTKMELDEGAVQGAVNQARL